MRGLDSLAEALGYSGDHGYILSDAFAQQPNHRHALRHAAQVMRVQAAFGLWTGRGGALLGPERARFTPLVFLAEVSDAAEAKAIHRSVWSQGLAPYLLAISFDRIWVCQGFAFSSTDWKSHAKEIEIADPTDLGSIAEHPSIQSLRARTLRSSLAWQDKARSADEFVDERLLRSLANLSVAFSDATEQRRGLEPAVINALIARLLYFYFLVDRHFITKERLKAWELPGIGLDWEAEWSLHDIQVLFQRLDKIFNGSIFPMPEEYAHSYDAAHINLLRRVLRHSNEISSVGLQLSFFDYDFSSIRTETISAIYEMFLTNEDKDAGKLFGAFYTPPYLADYTLDRLEDKGLLKAGVRVLDPAAGSGVFLVGAYRRIVESALAIGEIQLSLETLHALMIDNIFGVELNPTACHVAAFSLYLTMLDYVDPKEASDYTCWPVVVGQPRLFPPMLTTTTERCANIRVGDFFSEIADNLHCDLVIGNPPWVQIDKLLTPLAEEYLKKTKAPIGDKQMAELFLLKSYREHLSDGGTLGLLIPQKSLVNASSQGFTKIIREQTELIGVADLAHLRYVLFRRSAARTAGAMKKGSDRGARQAAAIVVLRKAEPQHGHRFWLYRPLRTTQPTSRRGRLWTLVHDWTQVQWQDVDGIRAAEWTRFFTCAPVDRRILTKLDRQIDAGRLKSLLHLDKDMGLQFKIEVDQNLDKRYVLSNDPKRENYWRRQLQLDPELVPSSSTAVPLPLSQLDRAHPKSLPFLRGNVVLMPRSCETAVYVEPRVAGSFFIVGCFPNYAGISLPDAHQQFLKALAAYMATKTFRYLCFINSRRMTIDRQNTELRSVVGLPWPFGDLEADDWRRMVKLDPVEREKLVCEALGLPAIYRDMVAEFNAFREAFTDGGTPANATRPSDADQIESYRAAILNEIDGGRSRYSATVVPAGSDLLATVVVYCAGRPSSPEDAGEQALIDALLSYSKQGASTLTQSRYIWHSRTSMTTVLLKPCERMHWTLDRAFADADLITAAAMSGFNSRDAA